MDASSPITLVAIESDVIYNVGNKQHVKAYEFSNPSILAFILGTCSKEPPQCELRKLIFICARLSRGLCKLEIHVT